MSSVDLLFVPMKMCLSLCVHARCSLPGSLKVDFRILNVQTQKRASPVASGQFLGARIYSL